MDQNKKSTIKTLLVVFAAILFYTILQNTSVVSGWLTYVGQVMSPIFIGIVLAFVINLPLNFFEKRVFGALNRKEYKWWNKMRRAVCLVLSVILLLGILTLVVCLILPEIKNTTVSMANTLPEKAKNLVSDAIVWVEKLNLPIEIDKNAILSGIDWNAISKDILSRVADTGSGVINTTISLTSGIVGAVFNIVIGFALSLYILASKENLLKQAKRLCGAVLPERKCRRIFSVLHMSADIFTKFITGQLTEAVIIGVLCYIGMLIFRMEYALMISAVISVTALVPVFGAFIGTAIGAVMLFFDSPVKAGIFILYIVIVQQIDNNFIYPRVVGNSVGLPGIFVLCSVTIGGALFGPVGMLLSVPLCAVIYCLAGEYVANKEKVRGGDKTEL